MAMSISSCILAPFVSLPIPFLCLLDVVTMIPHRSVHVVLWQVIYLELFRSRGPSSGLSDPGILEAGSFVLLGIHARSVVSLFSQQAWVM